MSINSEPNQPPTRKAREGRAPARPVSDAAHHPRSSQRSTLPGKSAFSLIELLVVLGLLIILSTIGVAAFSGTRKVSRLVGTEQLITGMIRQARMTARATGQAVMLYVDPDTRSISGVSRLAMWQSDCETGREPFDTSVTGFLPTADFQTPFGRTGAGFTRVVPDPLLPPPPLPTPPKVVLFDGTSSGRNRQLTRRPTAPTEGFQLGAVVKAQSIFDVATGTTGPNILPLLVIGESTPDTDTAFAGLVLRKKIDPMFASGAPAAVDPSFPLPSLDRFVWEIVGWVKPETGNPEYISSLKDAVRATDLSEILDPDAPKLDPTIGGSWMEISLIYTGNSLELQRDGRIIAVRDLGGAATRLDGHKKPHTLFIGQAKVGTLLGGTGALISTDEKSIFDNIQLVRLGADQPQVLPGGVVPAEPKGYRVLVHPDGRITALGVTATNSITWTFTGVFDEQEDKANITINPTSGTVTTTNVTLSPSAP